MVSTVKFGFSKAFFAEFLCVSIRKVSFVIIRYSGKEDIIDILGIKIHGIDDYFFNIEMCHFSRQPENHTQIPVKIKKCGDRIIFSAEGSEVEYDLWWFYRWYNRYFVNSLIEDSYSASAIPTIRKNKWESGHQVLKIRLNKWFWSKLLHVDQKDISYGIMKTKFYEDDELDILRYTEMVPVLRVKGVSAYYFSIERGYFFNQEEFEKEFPWGGIRLIEFIPAKVAYSRNKVIFSAKNGDVVESQKSEVYRHYMGRVANSWLL